jgi:type VI secretion system protein ImpC
LTSLGNLGVAAECPTVVGAAASLAGLKEPTKSYRTIDVSDFEPDNEEAVGSFRRSGAAARVGLGFPRILLRQPFGKKTDPVDSFEFEELASNPDHESFCWGSPAIALAAIWIDQETNPDAEPQITDMPMVVYEDGGGQSIMPAAEIFISDSAAEKLLSNGISPILGRSGDTSLTVLRLQSASDAPRNL